MNVYAAEQDDNKLTVERQDNGDWFATIELKTSAPIHVGPEPRWTKVLLSLFSNEKLFGADRKTMCKLYSDIDNQINR